MFKVLFFPVKVVRSILKLSGVKGSLLLLIGIGIGLLIAPQTGKQLRAKLQARMAERNAVPDAGPTLVA